MKLTQVRITDFQSVLDSTVFEIGDVTCLVGKNEAGKTALLKALYLLNPISQSDGKFDTAIDFPRRYVTVYEDDVAAARREPATVTTATFSLETADIDAVKQIFGPSCLLSKTPSMTLAKGYSNQIELAGLEVDDEAALRHVIENGGLTKTLTDRMQGKSTNEMVEIVLSARKSAAIDRIRPLVQDICDKGAAQSIFGRVLQDRLPRFLYFDEYYQMKGQDNLHALRERVENGSLEPSDHPLLGLIELAGLNLDQLSDPERTETLFARLEAAENQLTNSVLRYWSQNQHLRMSFDIRPAQPHDPVGMTKGINLWGRIQDTKHMSSTALGTRSGGFVWFFSFLAWYSKLRREGQNLILLLDEPGLSLHAKGQSDLLRYFEEQLKPHHQLIYTTHSPFMVDPTHFERVRIVQDLSIEADSDTLPDDRQGTKVLTEVLEATSDSLFPLQGALGYEIHQSLFIGPHCLVVEGVSDLLYIQTVSALLQKSGKAGLSSEWTITPVGGTDKVPTFVALIGAQSNLNVAVLIDFQKKGQQSIENLYKSKLPEFGVNEHLIKLVE
ncbi:MAG: AAA family ATPase [Caldilineaceae bacterium]|nr:AAA family ATPase [Caldilineaceae bacterium]